MEQDLLNNMKGRILKSINVFIDKYKEHHKYCPKCQSGEYSTTLMGYIVNHDKLDEYKDLNECICTNCGNQHIYHERIK